MARSRFYCSFYFRLFFKFEMVSNKAAVFFSWLVMYKLGGSFASWDFFSLNGVSSSIFG